MILRPKSKQPSTPFHPATLLRDWGDGYGFYIADALTGIAAFGATGSGKTSGVAKHVALAYLAAGFGGVVLTAKKEERQQWEEWAQLAGRSQDLAVFSTTSGYTFNFMDWEATRSGAGGGLTQNIVALLDEVLAAMNGGTKSEGGGDNKWFEDATHHMNMNLVDLAKLAGLSITLSLLRAIVVSAPQSLKDAQESAWKERSLCAAVLREADERTRDAGEHIRADFDECASYWLLEFPALSDKTRSIIVLSFSMLVRPFVTSPMRQLFSMPQTNITPEACFDGRIIIVDIPVQEFHLAGRLANLAWKYCFQVAVMRRELPKDKDTYLRPVFLWADEAQNFITHSDAEYQAVARSAGGCTVYLTQNRESYRRVLHDDDAVDSLLGNLQCKFFCQNSSTATNGWGSHLFGDRWVEITTRSGGSSGAGMGNSGERITSSAGFSTAYQKRNYVEPSEFATLRRGGTRNEFLVDCFVYNGGQTFIGPDGKEHVPFKLLTFNQRS